MKTIETIGQITSEGQLILQIPPDIAPGIHRIVLVIDERLEPENPQSIPSTPIQEDPILGLGKNPIDLEITDAAEKQDEYLYRVNDFWSALQDFRHRVDLESIDDDTFDNLRDQSPGRKVNNP